MTDKPRFVTVLAGVAEYYGRDLSEGVIGLYWQGLKQYDLRAVEKALWDHTQNPDSGQFMPKIADVTRNLQGRTTDQASIAWSKVDGAVRRVGPYQDVAFDDALIHRVIVDMGGWVKLGQITEKDWEFYGNQFRTRYQGYRLRGEIPEYPPVLVGISNSHNRKEGFKASAPVLIGDESSAKRVIGGGSNADLIPMRRASESVGVDGLKALESA